MQYRYATFHVNATSATGTIDVNAGDWILATVSVRSTPTYPSGWTILHQSAFFTAESFQQNMAFLCKQSESAGTVSFTVRQATADRIHINLIAVSDIDGFAYHEGTEALVIASSSNKYTHARPQTACIIWGCTSIISNNSAWTCTDVSPVIDNADGHRLANFIDDVTLTARTFGTTSPADYRVLIDCVEVLYKTQGKAFEATSGTSLTAAINANADDWVLATVVTRSATTYPSGWTLLGVGTVIELGQRMAFLCKKASALETVSCAVTQATAGRIYMNLISCAGVVRFAYGAETLESGIAVTADRPAGDLIIWGVHRSYWYSDAPYDEWTCAQIPTPPICLDRATTQPRLANFIDRGSAGSRTFKQWATGNTSVAAYVVALTTQYLSHGEAVWEITDIRSMEHIYSSTIRWQASAPDGSTVTVQAKLGGGEYQPVSNGGPVLSSFPDDLTGATLYIKVSLDTADVYQTPQFSGLELTFITTESRRNLLLYFASGSVNSFRNAARDITLTYDGAGGLEGEGGPVEAFEETFTPIGLVPKPNQNANGHIDLGLTASGVLTRIYHTSVKSGDEHLELQLSASGALTHVDDI